MRHLYTVLRRALAGCGWTRPTPLVLDESPRQRPSEHRGHCPSGKLTYWKERLANRAVTNAAKRGELAPMKHYHCDECGYWHLAKKGR